MVIRVSELLNLYKFPLGRCVFALTEIEKRARAVNHGQIASLAAICALEAKQAMGTALRSDAGRESLYPAKATTVDNMLDRCLGGLSGYLDAQMRIYPGESCAESAEVLSRELLPNGVGALTHLPYAEEHAHVSTLLERARDADLEDHILALPELAKILDRLRILNDEYGELLNSSSAAPTRDDVKQGKEYCQELLSGVMALIIGAYTRPTAPNQAALRAERDQLLEPILLQNEAIRVARKRRRLVADVDPQTGEELPQTGESPDTTAPDTADAGAATDAQATAT